eukprot:355819-Chlamydomonas_euryale.AAC.3
MEQSWQHAAASGPGQVAALGRGQAVACAGPGTGSSAGSEHVCGSCYEQQKVQPWEWALRRRCRHGSGHCGRVRAACADTAETARSMPLPDAAGAVGAWLRRLARQNGVRPVLYTRGAR